MTQEQFIDKACRWLVEHSYNSETQGEITYTSVITEGTLIEDFYKAMTKKINPIFERCLAKVNPDIRAEVRKNMDAALIWHKASEELPKENKPVIVAFKFRGEWIYDKGYYADGEWWANSLSVLDIIDYWIEIPELPKED